MPAGPYTSPISTEQAHELQLLLAEEGFVFVEKEYALYSAAKAKLNVTVFDGKKGLKLVVQGKETEDFIRFTLEPRSLRRGQTRLRGNPQPGNVRAAFRDR